MTVDHCARVPALSGHQGMPRGVDACYMIKGIHLCRDAKAAMSAVRNLLLPAGALGDSTAASEPVQGHAKRSSSALMNDGALSTHPIVGLMALSIEYQLEKVHAVLCMCFASLLENSSSWALSEAFMPEGCVVGSCGLPSVLSPTSALKIMAHISSHGLERLLKVRPRAQLHHCDYTSCTMLMGVQNIYIH